MMNGGGWNYGQSPFPMQQRALANRSGNMQDMDGCFERYGDGLARFEDLDEPGGNSLLLKEGLPL